MEVHCLEIPHGSEEYQQTIRLRNELLRKPLGLSFKPEDLAGEEESFHLVAQDEAKDLLACLVLKPLDSREVKMRQVATSTQIQGRGVGGRLVAFAESFAREKGFETMVLHARQTAVPFYERLQYKKVGSPFEEVGIPHQKMLKNLKATTF